MSITVTFTGADLADIKGQMNAFLAADASARCKELESRLWSAAQRIGELQMELAEAKKARPYSEAIPMGAREASGCKGVA
ncbi:MAG TPA: hypothetical protein VEA41_14230 [Salinarimonas sp.]|nr:hypothetical protein [Salinarimonas sp.]